MSQVGKLFSSFGQSRIAGKLTLVVGTLLVPAVVLAALLYTSINDQVEFAKGELTGAEYFTVCRQVVGEAVEHRRLAADYLTGAASGPDLMTQQQARVEEAFRKIEVIDRKLTEQTKQTHTKKAIEAAQAAWKEATAKLYNTKPGDTDKTYEALTAYDKYVGTLRDIMIEAADGSKLTLDPDYGSYGLMLVSQKMVDDVDVVGRVEWRAAVAAKDKAITPERKFELARLFGGMDVAKGDIASAFEDILEERKGDIAPVIEPKLKAWEDARDDFVKCVGDEVVQSERVTMAGKKVREEGGATLGNTLALFDASQPLLVKELDARVAGFNRTLVVGFAALAVGLLFALGLVYVVTRGFTRQIREFMNLFRVVDRGDYTVRASKFTSDELGDMSASLNQVLGTTDELIRKQKEDYDSLQRSIMRLLDDLSGTADGDLTKEAEVTADATGAIADSFNHMIDQLRGIISRVQTASVKVTNATGEIRTSAQHLAGGAENQAEQIVHTSAAIDEMAVSIQQVADNATQSTAVAQQALATAKQGDAAVKNTIEGMNRIREQAQETAKRIKRLGETSQEIGQIVQLIDDIADRTGILALNASIQAAAAGDAGRGFAVVAEEVERLAVRATEATKKIGGLVKAIQTETNEAVSAMERNIQEVVSGSKVANQAGQALHEIEGVSNRLADLIQSITLATKQQARGSEALAKSMTDISQITQQTAVGTKQTVESVTDLAKLADDLRGSVSTFRLPSSYQSANGNTYANRA